jgi:hypothetical protein
MLLLVLVSAVFCSIHSRAQDQLGSIRAATITCDPSAPDSVVCYELVVTCPEVQDNTAYLRVSTQADPMGVVLLGVGGSGNGLYTDFAHGNTAISALLDAHYIVAQLTFGSPFVPLTTPQGWQIDTNGAGVRKAECRYATIVNWVKQHLAPISPLCLSGNSAGSAMIGYGLTHYGLDSIVNFSLLTSGPPFTRLDWSCDGTQGSAVAYCSGLLSTWEVGITNAVDYIDPAYQPTYRNACSSSEENHSTALDFMFLADSITDGRDAALTYAHPVEFIYGGLDSSSAILQGELYRTAIRSSTKASCVADATHQLPDALDAAQFVAAELINNCH